jgi:hypothetical protein
MRNIIMKEEKTMSIKIIFRTITMLVLAAVLAVNLCAQSDSRYDAGLNLPFNRKAGDVNPQTGNLTLSFTDVALPGRAGMNFSFSRVWSLNKSNVFNMDRNPYDQQNILTSDTIEQYSRMGAGWSTSLPYIFAEENAPSELNVPYQITVIIFPKLRLYRFPEKS